MRRGYTRDRCKPTSDRPIADPKRYGWFVKINCPNCGKLKVNNFSYHQCPNCGSIVEIIK